MSNPLEHKDEEWLSRRQAAERLVDIAYALTAGNPLEVSIAGRRVKVPVAAEVHLERALRSSGGQLRLELELTWSRPETG